MDPILVSGNLAMSVIASGHVDRSVVNGDQDQGRPRSTTTCPDNRASADAGAVPALGYRTTNNGLYHGLAIRSYLAEPIATKVVTLYSSYLGEHEADIRLIFNRELKKNTHLNQSIYNIIRAELLSQCVEITRDHFANLVGNAIQTSVSNQVSIAAAHVTVQHVAASSALSPAAGLVAGLALYKMFTLPKTLGRKFGMEIQNVLNGNFSQWTEDVLQKAFDACSIRRRVQDTLGNPVDIGDLKDEVELIRDVAKEMHIGNPQVSMTD
ncbi:hypothetical protein L207DRAFT_578569 [Hyaloscypha variabilis F]|uniref:Uncharacterized protein n=1 Tax=Hyaloscypha variabilis (strain UAMH 11265 / GT02V1 / F) TaxID=1149755 RepID=A0A2J6S4G3_HYAVF|nr:hypothetical protein L207DRAFT_578569 [Hyaloscypha variabilis F]